MWNKPYTIKNKHKINNINSNETRKTQKEKFRFTLIKSCSINLLNK